MDQREQIMQMELRRRLIRKLEGLRAVHPMAHASELADFLIEEFDLRLTRCCMNYDPDSRVVPCGMYGPEEHRYWIEGEWA